ncbi:hypothetical protein [uncultured Fluviicola sp.]|uniref:hypothetical protein n=1 Tax=uncultured Fluviicola sp. TaxID=463303 RepID=UPI0025F454CE|nr:hypothetical protein [uncultured Fluviicola sp.]
MSAFKESPELYKQINYQVVRNGFIRFYQNAGELESNVKKPFWKSLSNKHR